MKDEQNIKEAVVIKYDPTDFAPEVVAKGKGAVAAKILEKAKESNVPIVTDPDLVHLLNFVDIGEHIPRILYEIVAKVLTYVQDIDKVKSRNKFK